jgi:Ser/Thr protein kinase RdoA (MazF antagonist)
VKPAFSACHNGRVGALRKERVNQTSPLPAGLPERFGLAEASARALGNGLINQTWEVSVPGGGRYVLQRLNPIFPAAVNEDIDVVTRHLAALGLETPRLVRTPAGDAWVEADGGVWRMLTHVAGVCRNALETAGQARAAGELLGRFHRALDGLEHRFATARLGVHDTPRHLAALERALTTHRSHPGYGAIAPLGRDILSRARELPTLAETPDRVVHGDPKINNIIFAHDSDTARCLIDLDTLGPMPLPLELGDAFRSWCNPGSEDTADTAFDLALFGAAVEGYAAASRGFIDETEWQGIVPATMTILVELAARFCADALEERYFGWNPTRFPSHSEHNRIRAAGQLRELDSLLAQRHPAEERVLRAFAH